MSALFQLRSISTRLAVWYALAATTTLACLFVAVYMLLQNHLIHGLDILTTTEFDEVKAHLIREFNPNDPAFLERRLRKPTDRSAGQFYVYIINIHSGETFQSNNLKNQKIENKENRHSFEASLNGIGPLHVGEYKIDPYILRIATPSGNVRRIMDGYSKICLALLFWMMLASLAIGLVLSRLALRPVRIISETANRIRSDNLNQRIPVGNVKDEISGLAHMLNQMFDRLESSFNQVRRFSAEASHELKTPLSLVRLYAEKMLREGAHSPNQEEALLIQLEEITRMDQIIEELLFLSRAEANAITLNLKTENPTAFLHSFAQDAQVLSEHHGKIFAYTHDGDERVAFDDKRLRQVLLNLLINAINVSPLGGRITLRSVIENNLWRLSMEDEGAGLPEDQLERIFERFVRYRPQGMANDKGNGNGTGLGLAICRSIVNLHKGRIFAKHGSSGKGLDVVIEIPVNGSKA